LRVRLAGDEKIEEDHYDVAALIIQGESNVLLSLDSNAVSLLVALWGALTGTVAITLSAVSFYTERPRLKLAWIRNFGGVELSARGIRETEDRFARLLVTNVGRQPIRVIGAYAAHLNERKSIQMFIFSQGLLDPSKTRVLNPEQPSTEYQVAEHDMLDHVFFIGVNDAFGRTHRLWLAPWHRRFSLRRKMKLKGKKD
jgi:hypothetical protein